MTSAWVQRWVQRRWMSAAHRRLPGWGDAQKVAPLLISWRSRSSVDEV